MYSQLNFFNYFEKEEEFKFLEEDIKKGSGYVQGKYRIAFSFLYKNLSFEEFVSFLKQEYGMGGRGISKYNTHYNESGFELTIKRKQTQNTVYETHKFTWKQVAELTKELIVSDNYFNNAERLEFENYVAQRIGPKDKRVKAIAKYCFDKAKKFAHLYSNTYGNFNFTDTYKFVNDNAEDIRSQIEFFAKGNMRVKVYDSFTGSKNFTIYLIGESA